METGQVPLYEIEQGKGLVGLFDDPFRQTPVSYLSIPDLPLCDGALYVRGDSMYPLINSGDIVLYKKVGDVSNIVWGEVYLVSFSLDGDEYVVVKYVDRADGDPDSVMLAGYGSRHSGMKIPLDSIRALGIVKASVRFNSMG